MRASIVMSPAMSKRLIAKGVAALPEVRTALERGRIVVTLGSTNAFVVEELLGDRIDREAFAAGFIDDRWNINARLGDAGDVLIVRGEHVDTSPAAIPGDLKAGDVVIKGGNALDPEGVVGVLLGAATGGTVARYVAGCAARGVSLVCPIGLAKSIHGSVAQLSGEMGIGRTALHHGVPCGLYPLHARTVTEIDALESLFPVRALHVASGGVGAGAATVSLLIEGEDAPVREAFAAIDGLRGDADPQLVGRA